VLLLVSDLNLFSKSGGKEAVLVSPSAGYPFNLHLKPLPGSRHGNVVFRSSAMDSSLLFGKTKRTHDASFRLLLNAPPPLLFGSAESVAGMRRERISLSLFLSLSLSSACGV